MRVGKGVGLGLGKGIGLGLSQGVFGSCGSCGIRLG